MKNSVEEIDASLQPVQACWARIQLLFCMKSKPQLAFECMPSHDWMKAHPWLTNDILSFQSAGGRSQKCQLPATAETPLVNLPLAGLNKIWNVKSPAHRSFSLPCASQALRHISHVTAMNQCLPWMSEYRIHKWNTICKACGHAPLVSCRIWENIKMTDNWLLNINGKVTFMRKNASSDISSWHVSYRQIRHSRLCASVKVSVCVCNCVCV